MVKLNLFGGGFQHAYSSTWWKKPEKIEWIKNRHESDISVYVDDAISNGINDSRSRIKIAWVNEAKPIIMNTHSFIYNNLEKVLNSYDFIFTHDLDLIELDSKFKFLCSTGTWIEEPKIYEKSKKTSFITSNKNFTEGHKTRMNFIQNNRTKFDLYGNGFNHVEKKEEALRDYKFSIAIENAFYDTFFSEKVLDCFATGTVPIYKGTRKIIDYYNSDGIIFLDDIKNLDEINDNMYNKYAVQDNFERIMKLGIPEDKIIEYI